MTTLVLPEDREELPVDQDGQPVIDERFDLLAIYEATMAASADQLSTAIQRARVGHDAVSWDSVEDARVAAELIQLLDRALPIQQFVEASSDELERFGRFLTAMITCRSLDDDHPCIHELTDETVPGPLGPLLPEDCLREVATAAAPFDPAEALWAAVRADRPRPAGS